MEQILVAGAGIGGLAAALACARAGQTVQVVEQSSLLSEAGAGLQLGPNAVRRLQAWGLGSELAQLAATPERLEVHAADSGAELGRLPLGALAQQRYGAPYFTLHRADLQQLLLRAVQAEPHITLALGETVQGMVASDSGVQLRCAGRSFDGMALIGADGLWSRVRAQLLGDGRPRATGHVAYRALLDMAAVPQPIAHDAVHAWLASGAHAVAYPVRAGAQCNLVLVVERGPHPVGPEEGVAWNTPVQRDAVLQAAPGLHAALLNLLQSAPAWRSWMLHARAPVASATEMAQGRVALLGDAAHPMLPYLAQGAAMALEDAAELGVQLQGCAAGGVAAALQRYAQARWQRGGGGPPRPPPPPPPSMPPVCCGTAAMQGCVCWGRGCWICPGCTEVDPAARPMDKTRNATEEIALRSASS